MSLGFWGFLLFVRLLVDVGIAIGFVLGWIPGVIVVNLGIDDWLIWNDVLLWFLGVSELMGIGVFDIEQILQIFIVRNHVFVKLITD